MGKFQLGHKTNVGRHKLATKFCSICEETFQPKRKESVYCSLLCRNKATGMWMKTRPVTEETKKKLSLALKGKESKLKGKKQSLELIEKRSKALKGQNFSAEHRKKISDNSKKRIGALNPFYGKQHSETTKKLISKQRKGVPLPHRRGSNSHLWKGGISSENLRIRQSLEYRVWRDAIFKRDSHTCTKCGARNGEGKTITLNAHHVKAFSEFPELRFSLDNGVTLCVPCHKEVDVWAARLLKS